MATTGSTVPRRQLGRRLRDLRMASGYTVRAAAKALEWSEPRIWRIETGQVGMRSLDVRAICETYGAAPEVTEALMALAKETKTRGWWHSYGDVLPEWFNLYVGLEGAADRLDWYEPELVPGLMQIGEYAREVFTTHNPDADPDDIDRRVELRIGRQSIMRRRVDAPVVRILLNEAVLRRIVGSATLMAKQLRHVVEMSRLPNMNVRLVPFALGLNACTLAGQFTVMRFPSYAGEPPTVYAEGYAGSAYLERENEIQRYDDAFRRTWNVALDEDRTRQLMHDAAEEYAHG